MSSRNYADLRVLMCVILKPEMVTLGIIPEDHDWKKTTPEQAQKIKDFINKKLEEEKHGRNN